jgi:hypothetical protein
VYVETDASVRADAPQPMEWMAASRLTVTILDQPGAPTVSPLVRDMTFRWLEKPVLRPIGLTPDVVASGSRPVLTPHGKILALRFLHHGQDLTIPNAQYADVSLTAEQRASKIGIADLATHAVALGDKTYRVIDSVTLDIGSAVPAALLDIDVMLLPEQLEVDRGLATTYPSDLAKTFHGQYPQIATSTADGVGDEPSARTNGAHRMKEALAIVGVNWYAGKMATDGRGAVGTKEEVLTKVDTSTESLPVSLPKPIVHVDTLNVGAPRMDSSHRLIADVNLSGYITFPLADVVPEGGADLHEAVVDCGPLVRETVTLTAVAEATSLLRPYAKKFTFSWSKQGLAVNSLENTVSVTATDPMTQQVGWSRSRFTVKSLNNGEARGSVSLGSGTLSDIRPEQPLRVRISCGPYHTIEALTAAVSGEAATITYRRNVASDIAQNKAVRAEVDGAALKFLDQNQLLSIIVGDRSTLGLATDVVGNFVGTVTIQGYTPDPISVRFVETLADSGIYEAVIVAMNVRFTQHPTATQLGEAQIDIGREGFEHGTVWSHQGTMLGQSALGSGTYAGANGVSMSVVGLTPGSGLMSGRMRASAVIGSALIDGKLVNLSESPPASWAFSTQAYSQPVSMQSDYGYAWMNGPWGVEMKDSEQSPMGKFSPLIVRVEFPEVLRANNGFTKIKIHRVEHDIVQYQDWYVSSGSGEAGAFILTGAINFKDGETLGAGHVSKQDGFAFVEIARSGGDALKTQAPVITMTDRVFTVLERMATKRNAKRAIDPGNTYGPAYAVGSAQDVYSAVTNWVYGTFNDSGAINQQSVNVMAEWIAPPAGAGNPAGFPNGPTRLYWGAWNAGFTSVGSPTLIGYYKYERQDQETDFSSQSQDVTSLLHFNSGLGWRARGLQTVVDQLRVILTDPATSENDKKKKYVEWLISSNLLSREQTAQLEKGVQWLGAASTHDKAMESSGLYKAKYMEFVDMALALQAWGATSPTTLDVFIAYDLASFEGFHLFGIDSLNDIVSTEAGAVFGERASLSPYPPLLSVADTKAAMTIAFETARSKFRAHRILNPKEQVRRSLYSLLTSTSESGDFLPTIVEKHWEAYVGTDKATIWRSTIGAFCKKNQALFDTDEKRDKFVKDVENHMAATESTNWRSPFGSGSGIVSDENDVEMMHQAIEVLVLLAQ